MEQPETFNTETAMEQPETFNSETPMEQPETFNSETPIEQPKPFNRETSMDIIKITAVFLVISVHFFLNNGFYSEPVVGTQMYVAVLMRTLFGVCVPLFIVLTGYLMSTKTLSAKYYLGLKKILITYLFACIACIIFRAVHLDVEFTFKDIVFQILNYSAAPYAWYVEMYIGLFLLVPFLNLAYHHLETQKKKTILVWTMIVLTALPTLINIYNFDSAQWWAVPTSSDQFQKLVPAWWLSIYPVTYYYVGSYIREYDLKFKTRTLALLLVITTIAFGSFNYYRSYDGKFITGLYQYWYGFQPCIMTILVFALLKRIKANGWPTGFRKILAKIANMSLMMYLLSYIFDQLFYKDFNESVTNMPDRVKYFFLLVIPIFIATLFLSSLVTLVQTFVTRFAAYSFSLIKGLKNNKKVHPQTIVFFLLMAGAIIFSLYKAPYGFGGNDEAFYTSIPHRLTLGDGFFRDEWHLSQMSGFLTMPFVALYRFLTQSTVGIILAARYLYVILHAAVSIFAYIRLKRYGYLSIAASVLYFIFTPYDIMALSYNTMALDLLVLTGLLLGTFESRKKAPFILGGITFAASVLCCPYLVSGYVIYAICVLVSFILKKINRGPAFFKESIFEGKVFLKFTIGVAGLAVVFLIFLITRISPSEIFDNLPSILEDPEHPRIAFIQKMSSYFKDIYNCHPYFKISIITYGIMFMYMIADRNRKNHRSFYLISTLVIALFSYMLFVPQLTSKYYNALLFPIFFVGVTSYILCKNKPRNLFASLFILGIIYSVCVFNTSNQHFYIISMASAICSVASFIFLGVLLKELKERNDEVAYGNILAKASVISTCFIIVLLGYLQIDTKANHCFWEPSGTSGLDTQITVGPAKGIYTTQDNAVTYKTLHRDLIYAYKNKTPDNILVLSEKTWCYLALDNFPYGTFSAWLSGENDKALSRLETFYAMNPNKVPKYIYIPKTSKWDISSILTNAQSNGYAYKETEISYQLEKTN